LKLEGYNELPTAKPRNLPSIFLEVLREPMFTLLIAGGAIYMLLGDLSEAIVLLMSIFVILAITTYQERKTERALEALRDLSSPRALVIRDDQRRRIPGREVVRGDAIVIEEGDRVPADAVLWSCNDLRVDESLLTGESAAVNKVVWDGLRQMTQPGGDDLPFVFSGTLAVQGQGIGEVVATGAASQIGLIGKALSGISQESTNLQKETRRVVRDLALGGLLLCVVVVLLYRLLRGPWLEGVLAGITLAMAILPEEFPVVLTVFLALGAWRISRKGVLTRRATAIETLGAATVLCVDKTGTLTMNHMALRSVYAAGKEQEIDIERDAELPTRYHELLRTSILASEATPFDPMEKAFHQAGQRFLFHQGAPDQQLELIREYPLTPELLVHAHAWQSNAGHYLIAAKGAPEAITEVCRLSEQQRGEIDTQVNRMAERGLRVLGVAKARFAQAHWPGDQRAFDYQFLGLVALADPVRPTVAQAIAECYQAGMRVVMITGDYPGTARAIGREIGLRSPEQVITGHDVAAMNDDELAQSVKSSNIFARVVPEQKLRLVNALKADGEVVAMTGDGVNDAPALKAADIGVAMGRRGTDVAREAASLVLMEDDFASIVATVRMGRRIYDNIRNAMSYLLAVHVPMAGMSLIPILFGWPLIFFPIHVVFLEFVIDPACSIAFEAEPDAENVMRRPPRRPTERLFNVMAVTLAMLQGTSMFIAVWLLYGLALHAGIAETEARAIAFACIVLGNIGLILANLSKTKSIVTILRTPNTAIQWVIAGTLCGLAIALYGPGVRDLFRFSSPSAVGLLLSFAAASIGLIWYEVYKWWLRRDAARIAAQK
jgi:P-type Ca2+ transporter type 2C